jgi:hypothetical protein
MRQRAKRQRPPAPPVSLPGPRQAALLFTNPFFKCLWEILWLHTLLFGQFHGFTYQLNGQFQGISLEKSQPKERTSAGRAAPLKRTFGPSTAPHKRTFPLILLDLTKPPPRTQKCRSPSTQIARRKLAPASGPREPSNSDPKRDLYQTDVRRLWNERSVRDGVSTVLLFQVL